jgi:D-3-phosphoglycerate dehydrogenase
MPYPARQRPRPLAQATHFGSICPFSDALLARAWYVLASAGSASGLICGLSVFGSADMVVETNLAEARIVRLNAELHPISAYERGQYARFGLAPVEAEAHTPEAIIPVVAQAAAVFAVSVSLPAAVIDAMPHCRVISRMGTGVDKIDVAAATRNGIAVTNVPFFCVEEQADHAMALLLALARKLPQMSQAMHEGAWSRARALMRTHQRIPGQVLGLVGFGNSAKALARRARGFDMRVLAVRRNPAAARADAAALGVKLTDLDTVVSTADYVSLHLPLTPETYHLFDDDLIRKMKPGAYLINTARGAIVDEVALAAALRAGRLAGAGLDTFEGIDVFAGAEGPHDHPLLQFENVVATPHVAAGSIQAMQDVARGAVENVVAILAGHWPDSDNLVNRDVLPRSPLAAYDPVLFARCEVSDQQRGPGPYAN